MKYSMLFAALAIAGLSACDRPTVVNTPAPIVNAPAPTTTVVPVPVPVPVPGPAGAPGAPGADGPKGEPGKSGDTTTIIVPPSK